MSTYRSSIYSIQQDNDFKYYDKAKLNGWVYDFIKLGPDEFCLFTYQVHQQMVYESEFWFNVYYANTSDITLRMVLKRIGRFSKSNYREEVSTDSINLIYSSDHPENFQLREYRVKKVDRDSFVPHDTVFSTYNWDSKTKTFIKK